MADDVRRDDSDDLQELVRAVRELTRRVQQLERRVDEELGARTSGRPSPEARPAVVESQARDSRLESRIGSQWLNRVGVVAVLFGVAYLLRYVFVSKWLSAATWVWLGVCAGIVLIGGSEWFRRRGYRVLSLSLKATGVGISYLSLWAGLELYRLLSGPQTFFGLVILKVVGAWLALRESSAVLAALALIGGFLTPLLISIPRGEGPLFAYIAMLDVATAAAALKRDWWRLLPLSFVGTVLLYTVWYSEHYTRAEWAAAAAAATLFFVIFCVTGARLRGRLPAANPRRVLTVLEATNPAAYFAALYLLPGDAGHKVLTIPALCLSTLYFGLAWKEVQKATAGTIPVTVYGGLGIAFHAAALAVLLQADWLSLGWFVEAAVVMAVGFWRDLPWLRWGGLLLLCAAVVKAFAFDVWQLGLGYRTLSFIGLGVLLLAVSFAYQRYGFSVMAKIGKDRLR